MEDLLETINDRKQYIDINAKAFASTYDNNHLLQAIEFHEEEYAEIIDLIQQDFSRQLHTEETMIEYAEALFLSMRTIVYLRERFHKIIEDNSMDELMDSFQSMST